jgi:phosphoadenosine phosphosulfate reductase
MIYTRHDDVVARLEGILREHTNVCFANSLGAEDMVLTDMIARNHLPINVFTIDTGRLSEHTYHLIADIRTKDGITVTVYFPDATAVENYVGRHGVNAFYGSVELRKECCEIRKVRPLKRALKNQGAWVTGLRRQQAVTRKNMAFKEWDADHVLYKYNPLVEWSDEDVWAYIKEHDVPYNPLHDQGYTSIGCAPCTRAISAGEDIRAGRWWWESQDTKECGLHKPTDTLKELTA